MASYGTRVSRAIGASDKAFGGAGLNLPAECLAGEGDMIGIFDDFNGVMLTEAGNGTAHWETQGWILADFGVPVADGVGMNDIDGAGAFDSCIRLNAGTADDTGITMQLDRVTATHPQGSGGNLFHHIWLADNATATSMDNTTFVFACRVGIIPEGTTATGKAFIGWSGAANATIQTATTGVLLTGDANTDQKVGFHINGETDQAANISGISQRVGTTGYTEGTNFTDLTGVWNTGLTAGAPVWYDLALRMDVGDRSATANGSTRFYHRKLNSLSVPSGKDVFSLPGEGYAPWIEHGTVLENQIPNGTSPLVPTIEAVNGGAGGEIDLLVDWWAFGMSRLDR